METSERCDPGNIAAHKPVPPRIHVNICREFPCSMYITNISGWSFSWTFFTTLPNALLLIVGCSLRLMSYATGE